MVRSIAWDFVERGAEYHTCKLCDPAFKTRLIKSNGTSSSNSLTHLRTYHLAQLNEATEKQQKGKLETESIAKSVVRTQVDDEQKPIVRWDPTSVARSIAWNFVERGVEYHTCKLCAPDAKHRLIKAIGASSSNSLTHLRAHHLSELNEATGKEQFNKKETESIAPFKAKISEEQKSLMRLLSSHNFSFNAVTSSHFREFLRSVSPAYKVPSKEILKKSLSDYVTELNEDMISMASECITFSMNVDLWQAKGSQQHFLGIACNFLLKNGQKTTRLGHFITLPEQHSSENIADKINGFLLQLTSNSGNFYEVRKKLAGVTCEGSAILNAAFEQLNIPRVHCFCDQINLDVTESLKKLATLSSLLDKCYTFASRLHRRRQGRAAMARLKNERRLKRKPIRSNASTWTSTIEMIVSMDDMPRQSCTELCQEVEVEQFSDSEWSILADIRQVLHPLYLKSLEMGKGTSIASSIIPNWIDLLEQARETTMSTLVGQMFQEELLAELERRCLDSQEDATLQIASLLDPRYAYTRKLFPPVKWAEIENKLDCLALEIKEEPADEFTSEQIYLNNSQPQLNWSDLETDSEEPSAKKQRFSQSISVKNEILTYQSILLSSRPTRNENKDEDISSWWIEHAASLPKLSSLAFKYGILKGSSDQIEKVFSRVTMIYQNARRDRLSPTTVSSLLTVSASEIFNKQRMDVRHTDFVTSTRTDEKSEEQEEETDSESSGHDEFEDSTSEYETSDDES